MKKTEFKTLAIVLLSALIASGYTSSAFGSGPEAELAVTWAGSTYSYYADGTKPKYNSHAIFTSGDPGFPAVFCGNHGKNTPSGKQGETKILTLDTGMNGCADIRKVLFYGYRGPGQWNGFKDAANNSQYLRPKFENSGICITSMALTKVYKEAGSAKGYYYAIQGVEAFLGYIKDMPAPPEGFTVYRIKGGNMQQDLFTWSYVPEGRVQIRKSAARNQGLTALCPENYSFEGAEYRIYKEEACINEAGVLTADGSGISAFLALTAGNTYYVRETRAGKGYLLDMKIHPVAVKEDETTVFEVKDIPAFDPLCLKLVKKAAGGAGAGLTLEGAEYTVRYYKELFNTEEGAGGKTPFRTWMFRTDEKGEIFMKPRWKIGGDDLFLDDSGQPAGLIGTYTFEETKAPEGFKKTEGLVAIRQARQKAAGEGINPADDIITDEELLTVSITLRKADSETGCFKPQPGRSFEGAVYDVFRDGIKAGSITTDADGKGTLAGLEPGVYILKEIRAPEGYLKSSEVIKVKAGIKEGTAADFDFEVTAWETPDKAKTTEPVSEDGFGDQTQERGRNPATGDNADIFTQPALLTGAAALLIRIKRKRI